MRVSARRRKGFAHSLTAGKHTLIADEPVEEGGTDTGPKPSQLLALSLAACTAITIEMYADRKEWDVGELSVDVDYELDAARFDVVVQVPAELTDEQLEKLKMVAGKCPVHRLLTGDVQVTDEVKRA